MTWRMSGANLFVRRLSATLIACALVGGCGASPVASAPAASTTGSSTSAGATESAGSSGQAESARSGSRIPLELGGEPVFVGLAAAEHAARSADSTPFLVGGWMHDDSIHACSGGIAPIPKLLSGCETTVGPDAPPMTFAGSQGRLYWGAHRLDRTGSPAIVRVHTHDALANDCPAAQRAECDRTMAVEDVAWTGDAETATSPLSVAEAARLSTLTIILEIKASANETDSVQRNLALTPVPGVCGAVWPSQTYAIRGDPRFGLFAVFETEAERRQAEGQLDATRLDCGLDHRVARPAAGSFFDHANVLIQVFAGKEVTDRLTEAFGPPGGELRFVPFPEASLDESFRMVDDAEASRLAGDLETFRIREATDGGGWSDPGPADAFKRLGANALAYEIDDSSPLAERDVSSKIWTYLQKVAVAGSARRFVVHHPASTDPALSTELFIAYRIAYPPGSIAFPASADASNWDVFRIPA